MSDPDMEKAREMAESIASHFDAKYDTEFVKNAAKDIAAAIKAEREACAAVVEDRSTGNYGDEGIVIEGAAAAIRARGGE